MKSVEEVMNILEAYDLTGCCGMPRSWAGCSHHTFARYVAERGRAGPGSPARQPGVIDEFLPKLEELVERTAYPRFSGRSHYGRSFIAGGLGRHWHPRTLDIASLPPGN